jgi:hypothetical protein
LLHGLRACAGIPCRRSSVRDVHATAPVVNGDRDLGRIVGLDHRHLEYLHATSLSHPCSTFDKHCLSVLRAFTCSLSVRTHTVRWTPAARRARSPPQCGATYPLRFPAIEVVLACFGPRRASRVSQDLDRCRIVALHAPRQCSLQIGWQCGASQVAVPRPVGAYQAGAVGADSSVSRGAGA